MTTKVKGAVLLSRSAYVKAEFGTDAWDRVLQKLPEDSRRDLKGIILSSSWYPFEINKELDQAIVNVVGGGNLNVQIGVVCTALSDCHEVGTCDPATGLCSNPRGTRRDTMRRR